MSLPTPVVFITSLLFLVSTSAILGNGLLLLAFFKARQSLTKNSYLIICQVFCDFLSGVAGVQNTLSTLVIPAVVGNQTFTKIHCLNLNVPVALSLCAGQTVTGCLGVERFLAIRFPVWYRMSPKFRFVNVSIIACLLAVGTLGTTFYVGIVGDSHSPVSVCRISSVISPFALLLSTAVPIFVALALALLYGRSLILLKRQASNMSTATDAMRRHVKLEQRIQNTVSAIILTFFLFAVIPVASTATYKNLVGDPGLLGSSIQVGYLLNVSSTMLICFWRNKEAKKGLQLLCGCGNTANQIGPSAY